MRKINRSILVLLLIAAFALSGCSYSREKEQPKKTYNEKESVNTEGQKVEQNNEIEFESNQNEPEVDDNQKLDEISEEYPIQKLESQIGVKTIESMIFDTEYMFTASMQEEFVGETFLIEGWLFDVYEKNEKLYVKINGGIEEVYIIEITRDQFELIKACDPFSYFAFVFSVESVRPALNFFSGPTYDKTEEGVVLEDSIETYIYTDGNFKILSGICSEIYVLNESQNKYEHVGNTDGEKYNNDDKKVDKMGYTNEEINKIKEEAYNNGYENGRDDGYDSGYEDGKRVAESDILNR